MLGRAIAATAEALDASVLHCHHYSPFVYGCLSRAFRPASHVVYTEHGRLSDAPASPKRRFANHVLAPLANAVFAVSGELRDQMVAEGFARSAVDTIYNGIEPGEPPTPTTKAEARAALGLDCDAVVIGTIARLDPVKNLATLIASMSAIRADVPVILLVIGEGPERPRLEAEAARITGSDIRFLGHQENARRWLAACDVYANTSMSEGVSLTILEAMASGLPVVATAVGGTPEVITEACGRLVPPRSAASVARALNDLVAQPDLRQRLGDEARRRVTHSFALERMVQTYRDVYLEV
jgi:glycosyltransferase involved in cell wall biosynthesis